MTSTDSYDYVQIVVDDDWGLVGIVPNNGSGDRMKKMGIEPVTRETKQLQPQDASRAGIHNGSKIQEAPKIITEAPPQITPAEPPKIQEPTVTTKINPNSLSGLAVSEGNQVFVSAYQTRTETSLGNISDLSLAKLAKENVLVGFGK